jgi:isopentenyl-diphosphate Delta-isomerase
MTDVNAPPTTESRKVDHIRINLERDVQFPNVTTGLEKYRFMHQAVPEIDLADVKIDVSLFGHTLASPILISSMTGGTDLAERINHNLAEAAQAHNIAMGLGSQRAAIEDDELASSYVVRQLAPDVMLFANVGAVQLNYGYGVPECQRAVDMVEANALILHFNVLQEAVQPEGDTNFAGLLSKVEAIVKGVSVPVIAKEVGWGFSRQNVRDLTNAGIAAIDVAGSGGTSWSEVEYHRAPSTFHAQVASGFVDWGIPTADAIRYAVEEAPNAPVFASGGLRDGIDVAKSIALGSTLTGMAGPFLKAANQSAQAVDEFIRVINRQLQVAMLCAGVKSISELQQVELQRLD